MLNKIAYVADYEGRSVNSHVLVLIRENIKAFEDANGVIEGNIQWGDIQDGNNEYQRNAQVVDQMLLLGVIE